MVNGCFQHEPSTLISSSHFTSDSSTPHFAFHFTTQCALQLILHANRSQRKFRIDPYSFLTSFSFGVCIIPVANPFPKKRASVQFPKLNPIRGFGLIKSENLTGTLRLFNR